MGIAISKSGSDGAANAAKAAKSSDNESSAKAPTAKAEGNPNEAPRSSKAVEMLNANYPASDRVAGFLGEKRLDEKPSNEKEQKAQEEQQKTGMRALHALHLGAKKDEDAGVATERRRQMLSKFLLCVAQGKQDEAEKLLKISQKGTDTTSTWLLGTGNVCDYSGREFTGISAYEYAYWAKDTHMCRMLERYMSDETKADIAQRIKKMEYIDEETNEPVRFTYRQHGNDHNNAHFDLSALKTALNEYVQGYNNWARTSSWTAMEAAWMKVGLAQRDVPVHVINEYCRKDRSFDPCPGFTEDKLPRELMFYNFASHQEDPLFPLVISASSGLGVDFILRRGEMLRAAGVRGVGWAREARLDLAALSRLDEVRSADLKLSREILGLIEPEHVHGSQPF